MKILNKIVDGCDYTRDDLGKVFSKLDLLDFYPLLEFYSLNSGQEFKECLYEEYRIAGWFNIQTDSCIAEQRALSFQDAFLTSREFVPTGLVPFAYNSQNDYFLLSEKFEVFFLRNDMIYIEDGAMVKICESFEVFISELKFSDN